MKTRATIVLLLVLAFAGNADAQPEPGVLLTFEHWAYDALDHLDYALNGALLSGVTQQQDPRVTRGQCAIFALQSMRLFLMTGYDPAEAAADQPPPRRGTASSPPPLGEEALKWRMLALEFLPEIIAAGEPAEFLGGDAWWPGCCLIDISDLVGWGARERPDRPLREPAPVVRGYAKNTAIATLRSIHHDHWLYPETQRMLWAAAEMDYSRAPHDETVTPADTVPIDHWVYQSMLRLVPVAFPGRDLNVLGDRAPTRYEIAFSADRALHELRSIEEPTEEHEALAATWALLTLEMWPEIADLNAPVIPAVPGMTVEEPGKQAPLRTKGNELPEDHWLHPTIMRVLRIGRGDG